MKEKQIGLFDSGLGGLTVMKALIERLPNESIVYFGDTGRIPYGSKSEETVLKYTKSDIRFLKTFAPKLIVAACGTASSIALPHLAENSDIPLFGVTEAASRAAVRATRSGSIGVIGTEGTVRSGAYETFMKAFLPEVRVTSVACPMFVPLVENGYADAAVSEVFAREYLAPIQKAGADTLILGCTHYPLLENVIRRVMGDGVTLIHPGASVAEEIAAFLEENDALADGKEGEYRFYLSDHPESFEKLGSLFLKRPIKGLIEQVDIEAYTE